MQRFEVIPRLSDSIFLLIFLEYSQNTKKKYYITILSLAFPAKFKIHLARAHFSAGNKL